LSKSILDAGWGYFISHLVRKGEAGCQVELVDPANTSKTCPNCGAVFEDLGLSHRWVECSCGLSVDRDVNAAINILNRVGHTRQAQHMPVGKAWPEKPHEFSRSGVFIAS
jgi:putative transposase